MGENYIEERIVEALDEKYCGITNRDYRVLYMYKEGWTEEELGLLFSVSQQAISKTLKKMMRLVVAEGEKCPC